MQNEQDGHWHCCSSTRCIYCRNST